MNAVKDTGAPAAQSLPRRCLRWLKKLFTCEREIPRDRASHITYLAIFLVFILAPFLFELHPTSTQPLTFFGYAPPPGCPSQYYFHLECPGCGITRSFVAFAHGEWALSWHYHRIGILLYLFFAARVPVHAWLLYRPKSAAHPLLEGVYNVSAWIMIALLLLNWLVGLFTGSNGGSLWSAVA